MIISCSKNFVFIHNPKVAGTSIRQFLSQYDSFDNYFWHRGYITGIDHVVDKPHIPLNDLAKTEFYQHLVNNENFVFGFVRNPYERVYSAYLEKTRQWKNVDLSFNDFVAQLDEIKIRYDYNYIHFCPQHYFFYNGKKCLADFIGKIEMIDIDFNTIKSLIGIDGELKQVNRSQNDNIMTYIDFYNQKSVEIVNRLYEKDFLLFNYPMIGDFKSQPHGLSFDGAFEEYGSQSPTAKLLQQVDSLSLELINFERELFEKNCSITDLEDKLAQQKESYEEKLNTIYASKAWKVIEMYRQLRR
ncbi:sulfotransferase family 2 domain-containing protein [Vibrio sp. M250220]|uniref:sulfotransferase family 2 domain-containing protein n=1 Tax=Vibrio sp. M250220 TaxID=3020894 RepID=UPI002F422430